MLRLDNVQIVACLAAMQPVETTYIALADALEKRLALIADRAWVERDAAGHLEALKDISLQLDSLSAALPRPLPGDLAHYLERRSYDKALAFIRALPKT